MLERLPLFKLQHVMGSTTPYVADAVQARPERFTGVFSIDLMAKDAPERMRYWVERGLTGCVFLQQAAPCPLRPIHWTIQGRFPLGEAAQD
jgi:hypothetical protein